MSVTTQRCSRGFALLAFSVLWLNGCSPNAGGTAEYYSNDNPVDAHEVGSPSYESLVVGQVFFGAYLKGTDETAVTGGPPFKVNLGAYSLTQESVPVEILSAEVTIGTRESFHILHRFAEQALQTEIDQDPCEDCGHFGSVWFHTPEFLDASASRDEHVTLQVRVRVGYLEDAEVGELVFEFVPEIKEIGYFRIPG